jgi:UDP-N-acetylglucosamine 2-epimerase
VSTIPACVTNTIRDFHDHQVSYYEDYYYSSNNTEMSRIRVNVVVPKASGLVVIEPVGYLEMLNLLKHARMALADSDELQKEAFWSRVPSVTLRNSTKWTDTVKMGVNRLVGADQKRIPEAMRRVDEDYREMRKRFKSTLFGWIALPGEIPQYARVKALASFPDTIASVGLWQDASP